jgi:predicted nucleotidyltransferase
LLLFIVKICLLDGMKDIILQKLSDIELQHNVKILLACESGSRAWGFASTDSDFDVRFIYTHNKNHYLSIENHRDVIELPVNEVLDISGWDVRKMLGLYYKSNAALYEWLQSPIVYRCDNGFLQFMLQNMNSYYSLVAGINHYISMTKSTYTGELQGEEVKIKKYFYALRPILAAKWIADKNEVPPMEFDKLRTLIADGVIQKQIDELMERKATSDEKTLIKPVLPLHNFIEETMEYCVNKRADLAEQKGDREALNVFFRQVIEHI